MGEKLLPQQYGGKIVKFLNFIAAFVVGCACFVILFFVGRYQELKNLVSTYLGVTVLPLRCSVSNHLTHSQKVHHAVGFRDKTQGKNIFLKIF